MYTKNENIQEIQKRAIISVITISTNKKIYEPN